MRGHAGPGLDQQAVGVAVIPAGKLDDELPTRGSPGDAQRAHDRFGAGRREAEALDREGVSLLENFVEPSDARIEDAKAQLAAAVRSQMRTN